MQIVADQNIPHVEACFAHLGEVRLVPGREMTAATLSEADVLLVRSVTRVDAALLAGSPVRFVATATIGTEHVDQAYLRDRGIGFASAPGSNAMSVADWVCATLLTLSQRQGRPLAGRSIGVVGVGNVGSRVARKCEALGLRVVRNDPPLARSTGEAQYRPLAEVLDCDIVTIHTPLTRQGPDRTYHLVDREFLAPLPRGATLINAARGAVHDTQALKAALAEGQLGAVALDVWEDEPRIDADLLRATALGTPHIAGYSLDGKVAGLLMIYRATCAHLNRAPEHAAADFLPEPAVPRITVEPADGDLETAVHGVVRQVYPIVEDDARMRGLLELTPAERALRFDALRKHYPIRREFQNTTVEVPSGPPGLSRILAGIGFRVDNRGGRV